MTDFLFFIVLIFLMALSIFVYRFNGKKEFIRFDIVQFFYAFVLAPIGFVWFKTFLYGLLQSELNTGFSSRSVFIIDTAFSVYFLYIFAFIVIHSLTKTFNLKRSEDPLYDLFHHSEYFHLWLAHLVIFGGSMILVALLSIANVFIPLDVTFAKPYFYGGVGLGFLSGILFFIALWIADPKLEGAHFLRLMKLVAAVIFIVLVGVYFTFSPKFSSHYLFFWMILFAFAGVTSCSAFAYKSVKAQTWFTKVVRKFASNHAIENLQLFKK